MSLKMRSLGLMGSAARGILITDGTNATPIVPTITAGHRLKDGDRIAIAGVTTLTSMNGDWSVDTVAATTCNLTGSAGNGAFGGTAVVAALMDKTPHMAKHSGVVYLGNQSGAAVFVGTAVIEYADSVDATQFYYTASTGTATAGFGSALLTGEIAIPATSAGLGLMLEVLLRRYMAARCTSYTSGGAHVGLLA